MESFPGRVKIVARVVRQGDISCPIYGYYDFSHEKKVSKGDRKAVYTLKRGEGKSEITLTLSAANEAIC